MQTKKPQDKFLSVLKGRVLDIAVDLRKNSKTYGKHFKIVLSEKNGKHLFVPKGFAHGFLVLSEQAIVNYKVDNFFDSKLDTGVKYDDKQLDIKWNLPSKDIIISDKDKDLPSL